MKKVAILIGAVAIGAAALAGNSVTMGVTGAVTAPLNPTIAWNGAVPSWDLTSVAMGSTWGANAKTVNVDLSDVTGTSKTAKIVVSTVGTTWMGINAIQVGADSGNVTDLTTGASATSWQYPTTYTTDTTNIPIYFQVKSGQVASTAGTLNGTSVSVTATYTT